MYMFRLTTAQMWLVAALFLVIFAIFLVRKEPFVTGYVPTYTARIPYKDFWACPDGTVDTGNGGSKQCLTSPYGPVVWRGGRWSCPAGMVPNNSSDWNQKCIAGYSERKHIGEMSKCYDSEIDTGIEPTHADWYQARRQCAVANTVFTTRELIDGAWQCPSGTRDTGYSWKDGENGGRQCQILPLG
jgi:hypothetical protein